MPNSSRATARRRAEPVKPVEQVVIVGSGFAAWASACMLARATAGRVTVSVVAADLDDDGSDELLGSCRPAVLAAHRNFGIEEPAFMRASGATYKLATVMHDWRVPGDSYIHAFGDIGARLDSVPFHQLMNRVRLASQPVPRPEECSLAAMAARGGRFAHPAAEASSVNSTYDYACHFDAAAATAYFRGLAQRHGVRLHAGRLREVSIREPGFIETLVLDGGERIGAQLFLDCSGAGSRLLGQALGVPFDSWRQWLPCDRVVHLRAPRAGDPPPMTATAATATGWRLRVPLQSEDVHALFYASEHCSDEQAARELGGMAATLSPASFVSGRRRRFWYGNCVAIGAAAGNVDPLAQVSAQLIQDSIVRLLQLFPHEDCAPGIVGEYERLTTLQYQRARDFAVLPFRLSQREDSSFWKQCRSLPLPDELEYRLQLFGHGGRLARFDDELFDESDWVSVLLGQGLWPQRADPLTLSMDVGQLIQRIQRMREVMRRAAEALPPHRQYLDQLGLRNAAAPLVPAS
jgi:tryptophan 7-halogenase